MKQHIIYFQKVFLNLGLTLLKMVLNAKQRYYIGGTDMSFLEIKRIIRKSKEKPVKIILLAILYEHSDLTSKS